MPMRLSDILLPNCIKIPLESSDKQSAVFELCEFLSSARDLNIADQLKQAVWQREMTRTTGIGHSIAIPHGKVTGLPGLCMAVGKTATPIEFGAIDKKPVQLIILLASNIDNTGPHIQALSRISQILINEDIRERIISSSDAAEFYSLFIDNEAGINA